MNNKVKIKYYEKTGDFCFVRGWINKSVAWCIVISWILLGKFYWNVRSIWLINAIELYDIMLKIIISCVKYNLFVLFFFNILRLRTYWCDYVYLVEPPPLITTGVFVPCFFNRTSELNMFLSWNGYRELRFLCFFAISPTCNITYNVPSLFPSS